MFLAYICFLKYNWEKSGSAILRKFVRTRTVLMVQFKHQHMPLQTAIVPFRVPMCSKYFALADEKPSGLAKLADWHTWAGEEDQQWTGYPNRSQIFM